MIAKALAGAAGGPGILASSARGTVFVAALLCAAPLWAQVVKLEIVSREPMNKGEPVGAAGAFELIRGRIHGEVDPKDPRNAIIQDLDLAPRNARGRVEYVATFALAKPVDLAKASRVLIYEVVPTTKTPYAKCDLAPRKRGQSINRPSKRARQEDSRR